MRTIVLAGACVLALAASSAKATIYIDNTGDTFFGGILDISSVEVTDDGTNIQFKMTVVGNIQATDWGNYMYHISTGPGGDTSTPVGNPWTRPISYLPDGGADFWIGNWVNGGGGSQFWQYSAGSWGLLYTNTPAISANSHTVTHSLASLGLSPGQTFCFDAYASGGGSDGAVDSLGNGAQQIANWSDASTAHPVCYTTTPEPGSLAPMCLGALAILRRKR